MKKHFVLGALTLICCMMAQALPFVPTTDPSSSSTKWYYLKTEGLYVVGGENVASVSSTSSNSNAQLWCFVGTPSGYKLYNKQYGKYLGDEGYMIISGSEEDYMIVYYKEYTSDTFLLWHTINDNGVILKYYLYYDSEWDELATYGTGGSETRGCFSVEEAGNDPGPQPGEWTRYDNEGVGYKYIDGGTSEFANESANNLSDNNASTKFCGNPSSLWVIIEASKRVPVFQYSIVTANDTRDYSERNLRSWKLQGSNDNAIWDDIDVRTDYPSMPFANQEETMFYLGGGTTYRYFKFTCLQGSSSLSQISEVWINEQVHNWGSPTVTEPTCGAHGKKVYYCDDCHVYKTELIDPTGNHNYVNGVCSVCGKLEDETVLLANGQTNPYKVKCLHQYRNNDQTWPSLPEGWNTENFDDSEWQELTMPIASVKHTNGPFSNLKYNTHWFGEYNSYLFRRTFNIDKIDANTKFTFRCVHDDNMVVCVNGQTVINEEGWTETPNNCTWDNSREEFTIPSSAFHTGKNMLAVYIQQNWGGAYFDCEIVTTADSIVGDVNADGKVNVSDVTALINMILGVIPKDEATADVNSDGKINVSDVTALINIILGII